MLASCSGTPCTPVSSISVMAATSRLDQVRRGSRNSLEGKPVASCVGGQDRYALQMRWSVSWIGRSLAVGHYCKTGWTTGHSAQCAVDTPSFATPNSPPSAIGFNTAAIRATISRALLYSTALCSEHERSLCSPVHKSSDGHGDEER